MRLVAYGSAWLTGLIRGERGQDLIEYSLLAGFIALGLMAAMAFAVALLTGALESMLTGIGNCVDWNASSCSPF
jgi:Flp pilus assembly pilin Flp